MPQSCQFSKPGLDAGKRLVEVQCVDETNTDRHCCNSWTYKPTLVKGYGQRTVPDTLWLLMLYVTTQKKEILLNVQKGTHLQTRLHCPFAPELTSACHWGAFLEIQVSWHSAVTRARESFLQPWTCVLLHVETLLCVLSYFLLKNYFISRLQEKIWGWVFHRNRAWWS